MKRHNLATIVLALVGAPAGNVILGGLVGAAIDAGSGAMHSHKPNPLHVVMVPSHEATSGPAATIPPASEAAPGSVSQ
ncbi:MAG TPA: hypothetical protein PKJ99_13945 [Thermoanaerobaculales bacterium]|nr:hypothetical protein [Thermoanaerobaculales bacterium]